ncbi:MAG: T9SS C-terminal target domain-containing protein [Armatimonadetes bacterium]|nr:T9SS C-terminal target domain-containing protein [Akkermansiaceae bacterium]
MKIIFGHWLSMVALGFGGEFAPAAGTVGSDAIAKEDPRFLQWANAAEIVRGPTDLSSPSSPMASYGTNSDAYEIADASEDEPYPVVSLGDGGSATLSFTKPIMDVPGPDFAVFENGFSDTFLELGHVEVSSDGVNFFRFPSISRTQTLVQIGSFGLLDPTDLHNLAGKYRAGYGTPFDLEELGKAYPELDTQRVTHVRIIDVVGSIEAVYGTRDGLGNLINERFTTDFFSGGFDLDAVGTLSQLPSGFTEWVASMGRSDPSPLADFSGKGVPQLVEYFSGGSDIVMDLTGEVTVVEFDWLSYRNDGNFWIEGSGDLNTWHVLAESDGEGVMTVVDEEVTMVVTGSGKKHVTISLPVGSDYRFFRLGAQ